MELVAETMTNERINDFCTYILEPGLVFEHSWTQSRNLGTTGMMKSLFIRGLILTDLF